MIDETRAGRMTPELAAFTEQCEDYERRWKRAALSGGWPQGEIDGVAHLAAGASWTVVRVTPTRIVCQGPGTITRDILRGEFGEFAESETPDPRVDWSPCHGAAPDPDCGMCAQRHAPALAAARARAEALPDVQALLQAFPGARVLSVRTPAPVVRERPEGERKPVFGVPVGRAPATRKR